MPAQITLDIDYDFDFSLVAISCFEWEYRLAWLINKKLGSNLVRDEDLEVRFKSDQSYHALYTGACNDGECKLALIKNREADGIMMPELVQIDYMLKIEDAYSNAEDYVKKLREITQIQGAYLIDVEKLRYKEYLITE
ncbi:MAG: IPExxxVDY family protein [Flavobacteriales bacterium]|nr:IPExxxVDY family protein [Flavobacteriales bacterium]